MKEKIYQALKQAFSSLGLSDEILQGHADALSSTGLVTDDNLATVIQGQKPFLSSLQSGIDKRVTDAVNKAKERNEEPAKGGEQTKTEPDFQKMIKDAIAAEISPLKEEINAYKAKDQQAARANMISSKAKELGIPEWRMKEGFSISEEMDETAINTYLSGIKQNIVTAGLGKDGNRFPLSDGKPDKTEVENIVSKMIQ